MIHDEDLDATGLLCPMPVLKARKRLTALKKGQVLRVLTDDPAAAVDMPHFCAEQGHTLMSQDLNAVPQLFLIRKDN
jgi:tRNA 2-thiouridine synthesizing protein A